MAWHGYTYLELNPALSGAKTAEAVRALLEMGNYPKLIDDVTQTYTNINPSRITAIKISEDKRKFIFEIYLTIKITKAQVVTKLSNKLGYTEQQILNNIDAFTIYAGANWRERRNTAVADIRANQTVWSYEPV